MNYPWLGCAAAVALSVCLMGAPQAQAVDLKQTSETAKTVPQGPLPFILTVMLSSALFSMLPISEAAVKSLPNAAEHTFEVLCMRCISVTILVLSTAIIAS